MHPILTTLGRTLTSHIDMRQHSKTLEVLSWKEALYLYTISFICIVVSCSSHWPFHQKKKKKKKTSCLTDGYFVGCINII